MHLSVSGIAEALLGQHLPLLFEVWGGGIPMSGQTGELNAQITVIKNYILKSLLIITFSQKEKKKMNRLK